MVIQLDTSYFYNNLFNLSDPLNNNAIRLGFTSRVSYEYEYDFLKKGYIPYGQEILFPEYGIKNYSILWSTHTQIVCISDHLVDIFNKNNFSGWDTYPIKFSDPKGLLEFNYSGFFITGPSIDLDVKRMILVNKNAPGPKGKPYNIYRGYYFDESKYDGSDFFRVGNRIMITNRVYKIFAKNKVRNISITPILDVEIDQWLIERFHKDPKK